MIFSFRPAVRESVALLIGLAGGTGSGKTFSAMRMAAGIAGSKRFAVIDTEAGRAKHYADQFQFDHGDLQPPFRPSAYADAIVAADKAGYPVIVVDSMSHVWAGDGGVLDYQEAELDRMAGDNWSKRETCKMAAWIKPKVEHKHMVQKLLQVRAHLILCFRAEEKIEMVRGDDGKMKIVPKKTVTGLDGWVPVCEKNLPFELTASFLLLATAPGIGLPIKLQEQHRALFPAGKPINEESGKRIALWASGKAASAAVEPKVEAAVPLSKPEALPAAGPTGQPPVSAGESPASLVGPDGKLTDETVEKLQAVFMEKTTVETIAAKKDCMAFLFAKGRLKSGQAVQDLPADTARSILANKANFFRAYQQWATQR